MQSMSENDFESVATSVLKAEEKPLIEPLCKWIVEEQNPTTFNELVVQLNDLLAN